MNAKESNRIITGKLKSLATSSINMREVASATAWLIVHHAVEHGDISAASKLIDVLPVKAWQSSLVLFFRASGASISSSNGKHEASKNKEKGFSVVEGVDPLNFQTEETEKAKESRKLKAESRKAEKQLKESQAIEELQTLRNDSRELQTLKAELKTLKAELKALKIENESLKSQLEEKAKKKAA